MENTEISSLVAKQRDFFLSGETRTYGFRKAMLKKLYSAVQSSETVIAKALEGDLGKNPFESYSTETGFVLYETRHAIKKLKKWMRGRRVKTPFFHFPAKSRIEYDPFGVCLILSPWNYPVNLLFSPLVGAIAGGNTAVLKPSELAPRTAEVAREIITRNFTDEYISLVQGGSESSQALLAQPFDKIFFTGSTRVGKIVMAKASEQCIPVTLELGGKSPCIIDETSDLPAAARRVMWGKFTNAGQTCIAPDFAVVHKSIEARFLEECANTIHAFYGTDPSVSSEYGRIINKKHFKRLESLIDPVKLYIGGVADEESLYISPTILKDIAWDDKIMEDEIFGPLLPVIGYTDLDDVLQKLQTRPNPLALYVFSRNRKRIDRLLSNVRFGGGCVNNTILHIATADLPFGGAGPSGLGRYHGKYSFRTFTRETSIMKFPNRFDTGLAYPDKKISLRLLKKILK